MVWIKLEQPQQEPQPVHVEELPLWEETANERAIANFFNVKCEDFESLEPSIQGVEWEKKVSLLRDIDTMQKLARNTVGVSESGKERMETVIKMMWLTIDRRITHKINQLDEAHAIARYNIGQELKEKDEELHKKDREIAKLKCAIRKKERALHANPIDGPTKNTRSKKRARRM